MYWIWIEMIVIEKSRGHRASFIYPDAFFDGFSKGRIMSQVASSHEIRIPDSLLC
jgi:hypothetical protein